jgi:hypothetical protein
MCLYAKPLLMLLACSMLVQSQSSYWTDYKYYYSANNGQALHFCIGRIMYSIFRQYAAHYVTNIDFYFLSYIRPILTSILVQL